MKTLTITFIILLLITNCGSKNEDVENHEPPVSQNIEVQEDNDSSTPEFPIPTSSQYEVEVVENSQNDFGYRILNEGELFINQPYIPAVPGKNGFVNKEQAESVGELVIKKLESGALPPAVTQHELDCLEIDYPKSF